ncbi:MAG: ComEC/Rec2 family competence protein [Pirellulales bacterium]|nr:ComEC/Rec2 family competence protein [Pirellulales bacterium]
MPGQNPPIAEKPPKAARYQPLVLVLAAVAAGIAIDRLFPLGVGHWMAAAATSLVVCWIFSRRGSNRIGSFVLLSAMAAAAGAWHHCRWNWFPADDLGNFARIEAEPVCLEAVALAAPRELPPPPPNPLQSLRREPCFRLEIAATALRDGDAWKPVSGRAMLLVNGAAPNVQAGDRLKVFGKLSTPDPARNPGQFDYAAYLRAHRIRAEIQAKNAACVTLLAPGNSWSPNRLLDRLRIESGEIFRRYLDPEQADLAAAVLLGERERIDAEQTQAYMASGTIHVLSISGLHVGILAGALIGLMRFVPLPRFAGAAAVAAVTGLYAAMVDANPPVIRATILVLIACGALWFHRRKLGFNSLAAAGLAVLAINPCDLFNVGAQLSFLSVAVLIWFGARWIEREEGDPLEELAVKNLSFFSASFARVKRGIVELLLFGFAIWLVTTPLVMARFHLFSPAALMMNAILWIPMTLGLLAGFALLFFGYFCPPLAYVCGGVCNLNLWILDRSVRLAEATPGSHFWVSGPDDWWLAVLYGGLAIAVCFPKIRPRRRRIAALLAGWIAVGLIVSLAGRRAGELRCTFVSVGHGAATIVELPSGQTLLYDAGQMSAPKRAARNIAGCLWSRGITHLDAVVLSHADSDHFNALPDLLEKFAVGAVYVPPGMFDEPPPSVRELRAAIDRHQIPCMALCAGGRLPGGENCRIEALHPPQRGGPGGDNANSLVLSIDYRGRRILLPGDLEGQGLEELLAEEPLPSDVLLAPHHGSRQSNSPALAAWCRPKWIVLSGDGRWSTPETEATYRAVGGQILNTHRDGAISFTFDGRGINVETFLKK